MYTTAELAEAFSLRTRQIESRVKLLNLSPQKIKGFNYYNEEDFLIIKKSLEVSPIRPKDFLKEQEEFNNDVEKMAELLSTGKEYTAKELLQYIGKPNRNITNYTLALTYLYPIYEEEKEIQGYKGKIIYKTYYGFNKELM